MNAAKITRQSKSNLALAFISLGRERRHDITIFYAFCRVIDDIADSKILAVEEKRRRLTAWREWLRASTADESALASDIRALIDKYSLRPEMLEEIIEGVEMDLSITRYATFEDLRVYCYRVASAVGLVSIEIFGYRNPACKEYAIQLGLALQMTNIIRDVGKDLRDGRIYLPAEDLARFDYSETELKDRQYNERFVRLMEFEAKARKRVFLRGRPRCCRAKIDHPWSRPKSWVLFIARCCAKWRKISFAFSKKNTGWASWRKFARSPDNCLSVLDSRREWVRWIARFRNVLFEFVALRSRLNRVKGIKDYEGKTFENYFGMFSRCVDS